MISLLKLKIRKILFKLVAPLVKNEIHAYQLDTIKVFGDSQKLILIGEGITLNNTFFNCNSGTITIHQHVGIAHNCMVLTGSHDFSKINRERSAEILNGRDIIIEEGVFIGSGTIILGPCRIGKHTVIGAGSVVTKNIPENVIAAGNPCSIIKNIVFT